MIELDPQKYPGWTFEWLWFNDASKGTARRKEPPWVLLVASPQVVVYPNQGSTAWRRTWTLWDRPPPERGYRERADVDD